jgi:hypothetical protein
VNLLPRWREHETSPARCKPGATFIPLFLNCCNQLLQTDGMRRAGLRRDAIRSQVIDALEAQEIKETGNEED